MTDKPSLATKQREKAALQAWIRAAEAVRPTCRNPADFDALIRFQKQRLDGNAMTNRTAEEARDHYIDKMGKDLGTQFAALWQEVASVHIKWSEYVQLFGTNSTRVEVLNKSAPAFFQMIQNVLWEDVLLHIARLMDPPASFGDKAKANLTIQNLPELIADPTTKTKVAEAVKAAMAASEFCRDWRKRYIAHRDLKLAIDETARPLEPGSKKQVDDVLDCITKVLNIVDAHFTDSGSYFKMGQGPGGAVSLLYDLDEAQRAKAKREERLLRGEISDEDHPRQL
jgi:hypothetical protein